MKKLNVLQVTKALVLEKWGYGLPLIWPCPVFIRCNSKGEVNWEKAPVYQKVELDMRGNYEIHNDVDDILKKIWNENGRELNSKTLKIMNKTIKKHKILTAGYYFTYSDRQHPLYKDQTEKIASLYRESDGELINELNTEADKVHGIDKFTHEETIEWFDSILNPAEIILSGVQLITKEREKQISKHGFTGEHHFNHPEWYDKGQLIEASHKLSFIMSNSETPKNWDSEWFIDLCRRPHKERLIIAGALIGAEIDRLSYEIKNNN